MPSKNKICMLKTLSKNKFLVPKFQTFGNGLFSEGFLLISMGGGGVVCFFVVFFLVEGEEKECFPKFGVLIFILAHEKKQQVSWKHCTWSNAHSNNYFPIDFVVAIP